MVHYYYPPPGAGIANQAQRDPTAVGLDPTLIERLTAFMAAHPLEGWAQRWALWRHGYLVHVAGDFHQTIDVYSLRKTWHALIVGAALQQGRLATLDEPISAWQTELTGLHAQATWRHVLTQSAGLDYPYGDYPAYAPGEMWTYSDLNLVQLCHALAKIYGRHDFWDDYAQVARAAYFDAIGLEGWDTAIVYDPISQMYDGVRFVLSLEHLGRLGLLVLARGVWEGQQLVPSAFVEELETKQTYGMRVNYRGPNDGRVGLDRYGRFHECPYGYLTWVNTDGDYFPGADRAWAWGSGAGGSKTMWNRHNGIVWAAFGVDLGPSDDSVPHLIERAVLGPNPLAEGSDA
ncbi:MAG: serine hydrolase [Anaerolineae bacterium]|nr:serine hydrolase [Anaerolineae bacterium]